MKNNITENKLPDIKTPKTQKVNKSYNSCSDIINQNPENHSLSRNSGPQNIFFNIDGQDFNYNNEKDFKSYLYINSVRKKIRLNNLNNLRLNTDTKSVDSKRNIKENQYYLPVLMRQKIDKSKIYLYNKDIKNININKIGPLKQQNLNIVKNSNAENKTISLHLNTISNKKAKYHRSKPKNNNFKSVKNSKEKDNNQIMDDYLVKIQNYRKRLKQQMINRYKVQYLQHDIKKSLKEKEKEKENNQFIFNYDNKSINDINKNVNKALNIFYGKIPNAKISGHEKAFLNYSNLSTEKYLLNDDKKTLLNNVNIDLNEGEKDNI